MIVFSHLDAFNKLIQLNTALGIPAFVTSEMMLLIVEKIDLNISHNISSA